MVWFIRACWKNPATRCDFVMKRARQIYLGIDLGAASGRIVAGVWDGKVMVLDELHRFPNGPVCLADSMRWDVLQIWSEIQNGLAIAGKKYGKKIVSGKRLVAGIGSCVA